MLQQRLQIDRVDTLLVAIAEDRQLWAQQGPKLKPQLSRDVPKIALAATAAVHRERGTRRGGVQHHDRSAGAHEEHVRKSCADDCDDEVGSLEMLGLGLHRVGLSTEGAMSEAICRCEGRTHDSYDLVKVRDVSASVAAMRALSRTFEATSPVQHQHSRKRAAPNGALEAWGRLHLPDGIPRRLRGEGKRGSRRSEARGQDHRASLQQELCRLGIGHRAGVHEVRLVNLARIVRQKLLVCEPNEFGELCLPRLPQIQHRDQILGQPSQLAAHCQKNRNLLSHEVIVVRRVAVQRVDEGPPDARHVGSGANAGDGGARGAAGEAAELVGGLPEKGLLEAALGH
mmetsp:Transcript_74524/g.200958  ORF Transcript_74524/g.200958 Transcript_74524/m.200958 type:complete len:342 (-) Transcript_74524:122-1147(-)